MEVTGISFPLFPTKEYSRVLCFDINLPYRRSAVHEDAALPQLTAFNRAQSRSIALKKYIFDTKNLRKSAREWKADRKAKRFDQLLRTSFHCASVTLTNEASCENSEEIHLDFSSQFCISYFFPRSLTLRPFAP